jgi:hypothetical protein
MRSPRTACGPSGFERATRFDWTTSLCMCSGPTTARCGRPIARSRATDNRKTNDASIVLLGEYENRSFLLTGDAEDDIDPVLLARGLPAVDMLKVAHHGSATASSDDLLAAVRPSVAVVSVGAANTYGHPAPSTMGRLRAHARTVLRTDQAGTIETTLDAAAVTVSSARRSRRREPDPRERWARPRRAGLLYDSIYVRPESPRERGIATLTRAAAWHLRHTRAVAETAGWLALRSVSAGRSLDRRLVESAALLHDVDKLPKCARQWRTWRMARVGRMARPAWLSGTRRGDRRPSGDAPGRRRTGSIGWFAGASPKHLIVSYADKRAGQKLESMADRFASWERRYPPEARTREARGRGRPRRWRPSGSGPRRLKPGSASSPGSRLTEVRRLAWTGRALP